MRGSAPWARSTEGEAGEGRGSVRVGVEERGGGVGWELKMVLSIFCAEKWSSG